MVTKICPRCEKVLPLNNFKYFDKDSYSVKCKPCIRISHGLNPYKRPIFQQYDWWHKCIERDNYKCVECGVDHNKVNLIVHHIDNSRKNGFKLMDNRLSNLLTLCKPCHSRIHGLVTHRLDIVELRDSGLTFQKIADDLGISRQRVHSIYHKEASFPS